jgi:hypothetical protein
MSSPTLRAVLAAVLAFSLSVQAQNLNTVIHWGSNSVFIGDVSATSLTSSPWLPCDENICDSTNPSIVNNVGYVVPGGVVDGEDVDFYATGSISVVAAGTYNNYDERNAMLAAINVVLSAPATCTTTHVENCPRQQGQCFTGPPIQACSIPEFIAVVIEHEGGGAPSSMSITSTFTGQASGSDLNCNPLLSAVEAAIESSLGPFGDILGAITADSCSN